MNHICSNDNHDETAADADDASASLSSSSLLSSSSSSRYEPEYEPEEFVIAGEYKLRVMSVVPPPLEYMSQLHSQEIEISGRQVWCGSLLLAHYLIQHVFQTTKEGETTISAWNDKRVLELGSGTGLVGMTICKVLHQQRNNANPKHTIEKNDNNTTDNTTAVNDNNNNNNTIIVLTDGDEQAMQLLHQNLQDPYNDIAPRMLETPNPQGTNNSHDGNVGNGVCVYATGLRWGQGDALMEFQSWCQTTTTTISGANHHNHLDAHHEEKPYTFDMIVAGDVMYKKELPFLFFETVSKLLSFQASHHDDNHNHSGGGILWLCHVPRSSVTHEVVQEAAVSAGFQYEIMNTKHTIDEMMMNNKTDHDMDDIDDRDVPAAPITLPWEDLNRAKIYKITRAI